MYEIILRRGPAVPERLKNTDLFHAKDVAGSKQNKKKSLIVTAK
jgi:hypothetical protein